jgi:hypothetical protein
VVALRTDEWDEHLSLIVQASRTAKVADLRLQWQVQAARRAGRTWAAIGVALGISEQAARERFERF